MRIAKSKEKYSLKLYAICIMSNHIHYLKKPVIAKAGLISSTKP